MRGAFVCNSQRRMVFNNQSGGGGREGGNNGEGNGSSVLTEPRVKLFAFPWIIEFDRERMGV